MTVQVITDSTSDIPLDTAGQLGIRIVPIYLRFGDKIYRDGIDIKIDEFYSMLAYSPFPVWPFELVAGIIAGGRVRDNQLP